MENRHFIMDNLPLDGLVVPTCAKGPAFLPGAAVGGWQLIGGANPVSALLSFNKAFPDQHRTGFQL